MQNNRIKIHPILPIEEREVITFFWNNKLLSSYKGEVISSALIANGIEVFGTHHRDGSAQGVFCANGQCAKCTVIADEIPVKSCMVEVTNNMVLKSVDGEPSLPEVKGPVQLDEIEQIEEDILIIGGGPAGLRAALELSKHELKCILVDDKPKAGGKLVLQTHKFFGSVEDSYAGTRGHDIASLLEQEVRSSNYVQVWNNSIALYIFKDKKVGILKNGKYVLLKPKVVLNATGARERFLRFKGNTLAGIYGAGAFQTLVNRDLVKPASRIFVIGGGNVGLIAAYHALQAGIAVAGLVEASPSCGGYKVHEDKLKRLNVPIYTRHTIVSASGHERVEKVTIAECDENFKIVPNTEKTFPCDTILIAVGLESINEFTKQAMQAGLEVFCAGDAGEIAEASFAMFNGMIAGFKIANKFRKDLGYMPSQWERKSETLKAPAGKTIKSSITLDDSDFQPIVHCFQQMPCNPCSTVCPAGSLIIEGDPILGIPKYVGNCTGCAKCLKICPGLAIVLVDRRADPKSPIVIVPYELGNVPLHREQVVLGVNIEGKPLGKCVVKKIINIKSERMQLVHLKVKSLDFATSLVSFQVPQSSLTASTKQTSKQEENNLSSQVCLCERVSEDQVRQLVKKGITDMNQIKAITRAGMGSCGGKTCSNLIKQIFAQERVPPEKITPYTNRPVYVEVTLDVFAGKTKRGNK